MPTYKLTYFPLRARAEPSRLVFAAAGVKYEDVRIPFDEWPKHKSKMTFGQMPLLDVDGKQLVQSNTILRYLAKQFGLAGKNQWEEAEADQFTAGAEDLFNATARLRFEKDEARKAETLQKYKDETAPSVLQGFENKLAKSSSGFLVGPGLTYADLSLLNLLDFMETGLNEDFKPILSKYPNVQKHRQKISELPKIAAWIKKRPASNV